MVVVVMIVVVVVDHLTMKCGCLAPCETVVLVSGLVLVLIVPLGVVMYSVEWYDSIVHCLVVQLR